MLVSPIGKKRRASKSNHKRENDKKIRHSGGGKIPAVACTHTWAENRCFCHADRLTAADLALNFRSLYEKCNKVEQDQALLLLMTVDKVSRHRLRVGDEAARKDRSVSVKYSLMTEEHPRKLPVCKETFLKVLGECLFLLD